jgi:hypothetical protein
MTNTITITFTVDTTDPTAKLGFEAWVNDHKFCDIYPIESKQPVSFELPDNDGEHELKFILKHKVAAHTKIDNDGNIVSDARLIISDIAFDEIKLGHMITELATYTHDFNGTQDTIEDRFYGEIGCNGTVNLKFATPIYLWILEHM